MNLQRDSKVKHRKYGEGTVIGRSWSGINTDHSMDVEQRKSLVSKMEKDGVAPDSFTCRFGDFVTSVPVDDFWLV